MTLRAPLGPLLRAFFADHLLQQKAVSPQTIHAYRDAFRRLLTFLDQHRQRKPEVLTLDDLDAPVILAFLDHLEEDRANSIASRNARLGAVRSSSGSQRYVRRSASTWRLASWPFPANARHDDRSPT